MGQWVQQALYIIAISIIADGLSRCSGGRCGCCKWESKPGDNAMLTADAQTGTPREHTDEKVHSSKLL